MIHCWESSTSSLLGCILLSPAFSRCNSSFLSVSRVFITLWTHVSAVARLILILTISLTFQSDRLLVDDKVMLCWSLFYVENNVGVGFHPNEVYARYGRTIHPGRVILPRRSRLREFHSIWSHIAAFNYASKPGLHGSKWCPTRLSLYLLQSMTLSRSTIRITLFVDIQNVWPMSISMCRSKLQSLLHS